MATIQLVLLLLAAVLVSSVFDQIIPKVTAPLIQIVLGIVIGVVAPGQISIGLDAEVFLVVFIAPLLFHEARIADKTALWKNKGTLLTYAIGLVVVIMVVVGGCLHLMVPAIGIASCFALGAALGPTDAVAVASISKDADIPERQKAILQGESLFNDASGIVAFQFALAAAVTGSWSVGEAIGNFAIEFFGGIALGIVAGLVLNFVTKTVREWGLDNTTFHVLLDVLTPFIVYLLASAVHVSGVLAVVACGIILATTPQNLGPTDSRLNIVSSSVWRVLAYGLNGIVFVLLGTQLPNVFRDLWAESGFSPEMLIGLVLVITVLMHAVRLVWSLVSEAVADRPSHRARMARGTTAPVRTAAAPRTFSQRMRAALITTLSGAKGTITLAIMFTIPAMIDLDATGVVQEFPYRDMLIFLASGVILVSLLLATYIVPLLAPRKDDPLEQSERLAHVKIDIMRHVIEYLTSHETPENRVATAEVIRQYNDRIARIQNENDLDEGSDTQLRIRMLGWQLDYLWSGIDDGTIDPDAGDKLIARTSRQMRLLKSDKTTQASLLRRARKFARQARAALRRLLRPVTPESTAEESRVSREIQIDVAKECIRRLQTEMMETGVIAEAAAETQTEEAGAAEAAACGGAGAAQTATEIYSKLILEQQKAIDSLKQKAPSITAYTLLEEDSEAVRARALGEELEAIQNAYDEGKLPRACAQELRRNVRLMQLDLKDHI